MLSKGVNVAQYRPGFWDIPLPPPDWCGRSTTVPERKKDKLFSAAVSLKLWGMGLRSGEGLYPTLAPSCTAGGVVHIV